MKLNLLFLSDYSGLGGGETSLINNMKMLIHLGHLAVLVCPKQGRLSELAIANGIPVETKTLSRWRPWLRDLALPDPQGLKHLGALVDKYKIDLIHCNSPEASLVNGAVLAKKRKLPFIWTCHGPWERPFGFRGRRLSPYLSQIICVSKWVESKIDIKGIEPCTIYPGIEETNIAPSSFDAFPMFEKNVKKVALIGRFQKIKGHGLFVDAALSLLEKRTAAQNESLKFIMIGGAEFNKEEAKEFTRVEHNISISEYAGNFLLCGKMDNLREVYPQLDVVVVASDEESFSMVTLEALASGTTTVVMDNSAPREITKDKQFAYQFQSGNMASLAKNIKQALEKPLDPEKLIGRSRDFSIEQAAKNIEGLYFKSLNLQKPVSEELDQ